MNEIYETQGQASEHWRAIPSFSAYDVSDHGRIRRREAKGRWAAEHVLRPGMAHSGHLYVILKGDDGQTRKQFVHRLVAATFIGPPPLEGAMILHHDDDPTHNRPANLYWGNRQQNARDARLNRKLPGEVSHQGAQPGALNSAAVLSESNVQEIKRYLDLGLCGACIARIYNVRKETIYNIAKGRTWTHVGGSAA